MIFVFSQIVSLVSILVLSQILNCCANIVTKANCQSLNMAITPPKIGKQAIIIAARANK